MVDTDVKLLDTLSLDEALHGRACDHFTENDAVRLNWLCSTCQNFIKDLGEVLRRNLEQEDSRHVDTPGPGSAQSFTHHSVSELEHSFREGCHLCTLLWLNIDVEDLKIEPEPDKHPANYKKGSLILNTEVHLSNNLSEDVPRRRFTITLFLTHEDTNPSSGSIPLVIDLYKDSKDDFEGETIPSQSSDDHAPISNTSNPEIYISTSPLSPSTLFLAKDWLNTCLTTHTNCRRHHNSPPTPKTPGYLPTRLIDLTSGTTALRIHKTSNPLSTVWPNQPRTAYLHAKATHTRGTAYAALSHCWGHTLPTLLQLRTQNYVDLRETFDLSALPQTWQDAVFVARALGYGFLWIDALCIIQDSDYDWELEAAFMSDVYGYCEVNIAALGARSVEDGFGAKGGRRNPLVFVPCVVTALFAEVEWAGGWRVNEAVVRPLEAMPRDCGVRRAVERGGGGYAEAMRSQPLNRRAWVLQERALAPRTLYFGPERVYWDCLEGEMDEFSQLLGRKEGVADVSGCGDAVMNVKKALFVPKIENDGSTYQLGHPGWYALLRDYTRATLTFESDRLVAISAVVKIVQKATGSRYLAGLWEKSIVEDLLWCTEEPLDRLVLGRDIEGKEDEGVPSFSWSGFVTAPRISWPWFEHQKEVVKTLYRAEYVRGEVHITTTLPFDVPRTVYETLGKVSGGHVTLQTMAMRKYSDSKSDEPDIYSLHFDSPSYQREEAIYALLIRGLMADATWLEFGLILSVERGRAKRLGMFYGNIDLTKQAMKAKKWSPYQSRTVDIY